MSETSQRTRKAAKPKEARPLASDHAEQDMAPQLDNEVPAHSNQFARRAAEQALRVQQEQAADLAAMLRLQDLGSRLISTADLTPLLRQLLDAVVDMQGADLGCIHLYNSSEKRLELAAHRGFESSTVEKIASLPIDGPTSGARALTRRQRVVIADVTADESYAPLRSLAAEAGYRALYSTPLFDRNDQPLGALTTHFRQPHQPSERELGLTDLYARHAADTIGLKLSEQSLRESEERFRAIVEQTALGVAQCDFSGRFQFTNQGLCDLVGRTAAELTALRFQDITHPDDLAKNERLFARLARDGTPFELEKRFIRPDGSAVWVALSVSVLRDRDGQPYAATALIQDLTERNRAKEESRRSEEQLRLVVENAREYAIFSMDLERNITSWNTGAQHLLGYEETEVIGKTGDIIFTPDDRAAGAPVAEARTALAEGRSTDERWHLRKDGSQFWGSGAMMAMHDANNITVGLLKIFRDQTQEREAAEALARYRADLEEALRYNKSARAELEAAGHAKDRFLAVLSHELRTPLTPVVMAVQALARRSDLPPPAHDALDMIRRNIRIESHLIDDLLDLTRITRGQFEVISESIDLHRAIAAACEVVEADVKGKNQTLTLALGARKFKTLGDFTRLQQVVWNLLKNASKFTRKGGEITVSTRASEDRFFLAVSDTGIGIEPDGLVSIFEAFSQGGEWITREYGGLGLGLAISRATVEAHGGTIKAESGGRNQGATFTVELPLIPAA